LNMDGFGYANMDSRFSDPNQERELKLALGSMV